MLVSKAGAFPSELPLAGYDTSTRIGCKGLPMTDTPAYLKHNLIAELKGFIKLGQGLILQTFYVGNLLPWQNKLVRFEKILHACDHANTNSAV
jgi:hypothetical protein